MDLLHIAQHRFEELSPALLRPMSSATSDALDAWLRDDVCPVVAQLCGSQRFRNFATWSLTHLPPGSGKPQRRLVEAVDQCLAAAAGRLVEALAGTGAGSARPAADEDWEAELLSVIQWIAGRPWFDLACAEEYFTAERGLHLRTSREDCHAEFWATHEPRVPLGDYVCRGMFMRLDYFVMKFDAIWQRCFTRRAQANYALAERAFSAKVALDGAIDNLRKACHVGNDHRLRDAAVTLVQVYSAYAPEPELHWLGLPTGSPAVYGRVIRSTIIRPPLGPRITAGSNRDAGSSPTRRERLCHPDVIRGIASSLATIADLYRRPTESEDLIDWLRQEKRLVMVDSRPRTVYWDGELIDYHWDANNVLWDLLWRCAHRAREGKPVSQDELVSPKKRGPKTLVHRRARLSRVIPAGLDQLIEAVPPRGYRLLLSKKEIALLQPDSNDQLVEVGLEVIRLPRRLASLVSDDW